jgi:LacI family transcriptional regulator
MGVGRTASYTMRDVARLAGVSVATVSAVANGKQVVSPALVKRVEEAMHALDYHPDQVARSLKVRRTTTIGVVIPDFSSGFFVDVVRGAEDAVRTSGYSLLLCNSNDDVAQEQRHIRLLLSRRVDGILLASTDMYSVGRGHPRPATPLVLFDRVPPQYPGPAVMINNLEAAYEATKHLIQLGHTKIAFIAGRLEVSTGSDRAEGFRQALADAHLVLRTQYFKRGDFTPEGGYRSGLELLRLDEPPTAILSGSGAMTIGLLRTIQELCIQCPQQLSIIGFDEPAPDTYGFSFGTLLKPQLTVVAQPGYEMGQRAAQMLLDMLSEEESGDTHSREEVITLKAEIRIRHSAVRPESNST